jgi:hypothetical protein
MLSHDDIPTSTHVSIINTHKEKNCISYDDNHSYITTLNGHCISIKSGNRKQDIEQGQTMLWPKKNKIQKEKRINTNHKKNPCALEEWTISVPLLATVV